MQTFYHKETNNALNVHRTATTLGTFFLICAIDFICEKRPSPLVGRDNIDREGKREKER